MELNWREAIKSLAKSLAKGAAAAFVRGIAITVFFVVLNLVLSLVFLFRSDVTAGGLGSAILVPMALLPFLPFVIIAFVLAQRQGASRIVAGAVESQAPTLATVGTHYLGAFIVGRYGEASTSRSAREFEQQWQRYIRTTKDAPKVVRMLLSQVTKRVPLGEMVEELAQANTPAQEVPRSLMHNVITVVAQEQIRPSWKPVLTLFAVNLVWLPVTLYLAPRVYGWS